MNILVTGGCGYIGTLLIKKLLSQKHNVICIDNQLFGNYLKKNKRLKIIKENILNINNLKIKEIPIKTFYGNERSSVHIIYAIRFFLKTIKFKLFGKV